MKKLRTLALLSTMIAAPQVLADVEIEIPSSIDILAANEAKASLDGGLFSSHKTLTLPNGTNQIVFQYQVAFDKGNEREFIESNTIIATFTASDSTLSFDLPRYRNLDNAKNEINQLEWSLKDQTGSSIEVKQDNLVKSGMQLGRDYPREAETYNRTGAIAAASFSASSGAVLAATSVSTDAAQPVTLPAKIDSKAAGSTAEEMLYFWYEKADKETKQRFKEFVNQ